MVSRGFAGSHFRSRRKLISDNWKPFSSDTAILSLPEITWTDTIQAGDYTLSMRVKHTFDANPMQSVAIEYPFRLATHAVSNAQFLTFVEATVPRHVSGQVALEQLDEPVVGLFCTDVLGFSHWIDLVCHETDLLDDGWEVDIATHEEWIVGVEYLHTHCSNQRSFSVGDPLYERCWGKYFDATAKRDLYAFSDVFPIFANSANCLFYEGIIIVNPLATATLCDETTFRLVCRHVGGR